MKLCAACDAIHEIHPAIADIMLTSTGECIVACRSTEV